MVVADYRGGDMNSVSSPAPDKVTAIDDGIAVIEHVKQLAYVDAARISLYGVSLGGNLVLFLASKVPTLRSVVAGAPAPIRFLGYTLPATGPRPDFAKTPPGEAIAKANIESDRNADSDSGRHRRSAAGARSGAARSTRETREESSYGDLRTRLSRLRARPARPAASRHAAGGNL